MPAANFGWCMTEQSALCHPYGTKRKNTTEENEDMEMEEATAKRRCTEMSARVFNHQPVQGMEMSDLPGQDPVHLPPHIQQQHTIPPSYHQQHPSNLSTHYPNAGGDNLNVFSNNNIGNGPGVPMCPHQGSREANNNLISSLPPQSFSQDEMIMDLNDEVYSTVTVNLTPSQVRTDAEYEAACSMMAAMEDEGAPNPEQYRSVPSNHAQNIIGDIKGRMRCLSKPSRSSTADMQPYISDYY